jgi:hypothetical protein
MMIGREKQMLLLILRGRVVTFGLWDVEEKNVLHNHAVVVSEARIVILLVHRLDAVNPGAHHEGIGKQIRQ